MSYTNLLYHIVYATKERAPLITRTLRPRLHEYLGGTVRGLGGIALNINGTQDHVHILAKLRPTISVSEFLSKLKSGSHAVKVRVVLARTRRVRGRRRVTRTTVTLRSRFSVC